jgi:DNA primase
MQASTDWRTQAATPKQLEWLLKGNVAHEANLKRGKASELLEELFASGELVDAYSLSDFERYDAHAPKASGKTERRFACLECGDDKPKDAAHRSLSVNRQTGAWRCWRCKRSGKLKDFFEKRERPKLSRRELERLKLKAVFSVVSTKTEKSQENAQETARAKEVLRDALPLENSPGAAYVEKRGIPAEPATGSGVRYAPDYYGRPAVLFPMHDRAGELVAIEGRYIDGKSDPKTRTTGEKGRGVFLTPGALETTPRLPAARVLTEGPFDALALAAAGVPAVALCGTSAPEWLLTVCACSPAAIALDADRGGDEGSERLMWELGRRGSNLARLRPRGAKDWAELLELLGAERLRDALRGFSKNPLDGIADEHAGTDSALTRDDIRIREAKRLAEAGRITQARFVCSLLEGGLEWRLAAERQLAGWPFDGTAKTQ